MEVVQFTIDQVYNLFSFMLGTWWLSVVIICYVLYNVVSLIRSIYGKND